MCIKNNRVSMYFSPRKDKDIIDELEGIEAGDYNFFIKNLIRDGIKYRKGSYNNSVTVSKSVSQAQSFQPQPLPSQPVSIGSLMDVEVEKKEISDEDFEKNFDEL